MLNHEKKQAILQVGSDDDEGTKLEEVRSEVRNLFEKSPNIEIESLTITMSGEELDAFIDQELKIIPRGPEGLKINPGLWKDLTSTTTKRDQAKVLRILTLEPQVLEMRIIVEDVDDENAANLLHLFGYKKLDVQGNFDGTKIRKVVQEIPSLLKNGLSVMKL